MLRYNFSGHNISGCQANSCLGISFSHDGVEMEKEIRALVLNLPDRDRLLAGQAAEVYLPGWSPAAAILLAEWHGQFGTWPTVRWATRGESGMEHLDSASLNLNDVRDSARKHRSSFS